MMRPPFSTLGDATMPAAARADPVGFVRGLERAVIDEAQRVPEPPLAVEAGVDADPRPRRFLLTGPASLMTILTMASSLAGRMETIRRPPPAQVELRGRRPGSSRRRSRARRPRVGDAVLGEELIETARSGGHPEPPTRRRRSRRRGRHLDYVDAIVLREVARAERLARSRSLLARGERQPRQDRPRRLDGWPPHLRGAGTAAPARPPEGRFIPASAGSG